MEIPDFKNWLYIVNAVSTAAIAVYLAFRRKHDKNAERISALQKSFDKTESELKEKIADIAAKQQVLDTRILAVEKSQDRINTSLNQLIHDVGKIDGRMEGIGNALDVLIQNQIGNKKQ